METLQDEGDPVNSDRAAELIRALARTAEGLGLDVGEKIALSMADAARRTSLSERFLQDLASAGDLPSVRVGARILIRRADLVDWVDNGCPHPRWSAMVAEKRKAVSR